VLELHTVGIQLPYLLRRTGHHGVFILRSYFVYYSFILRLFYNKKARHNTLNSSPTLPSIPRGNCHQNTRAKSQALQKTGCLCAFFSPPVFHYLCRSILTIYVQNAYLWRIKAFTQEHNSNPGRLGANRP
jgi:hypothetical protein